MFYAVCLTFTLKNNKQHNLTKLLSPVWKYSPEFSNIFPNESKEEKRLFKLLKAAYVEARYNHKFEVTKENIDSLTQTANLLFKLTERICNKRFKKYSRKCDEESK